MVITLIQTLKDKNPHLIEDDGPFKCNKPKAWLGDGYYFWDTHEELGHWWGENSIVGDYVICRAIGKLDSFCWDFHNNGEHRKELRAVCDEMIKERSIKKEDLTVRAAIEFMKKKLSAAFTYKSIRALGVNSIRSDSKFIYRLAFELISPHPSFNTYKTPPKNQNSQYLDLFPPIQICLITKSALSLQEYKIVYPDYYVVSDFV